MCVCMCACMCECVYVSASGRSSSRTAALSFVCSSFTLARSCANSADEALAARGASLARSASGPSAASTLSRSISFSSIPARPRVEGWADIRTKGQGRGLWLRLWSRSISHSHLGTNLSPGEIQRPSSSSGADPNLNPNLDPNPEPWRDTAAELLIKGGVLLLEPCLILPQRLQGRRGNVWVHSKGDDEPSCGLG